MAARVGHYDVVALLCQNNADMTIKNYRGHTALDQAKEKGHENVYQLLRQQELKKNNETTRESEDCLIIL